MSSEGYSEVFETFSMLMQYRLSFHIGNISFLCRLFPAQTQHIPKNFTPYRKGL